MNPFRILFVLVLTAVVAACQNAPVTGRKQFMLVPESQVIQASTQAYGEVLAPISKQGKLNDDPAMKARVDRITARLVAQAIKYRPETESWNWQVAVIDDPKTLNAWCMAGGKMAIYSEIITRLKLCADKSTRPGYRFKMAGSPAGMPTRSADQSHRASAVEIRGTRVADRLSMGPDPGGKTGASVSPTTTRTGQPNPDANAASKQAGATTAGPGAAGNATGPSTPRATDPETRDEERSSSGQAINR